MRSVRMLCLVSVVLLLMPAAAAGGGHGSLTFCAVVTTPDGGLPGGDRHEATLMVENRQRPQSFSSQRMFASPTFELPLSRDSDLLSSIEGDDASCVKQKGVKLGNYFYSTATITGSDAYRVAGYTDLFRGDLSSLDDCRFYSGELFDPGENAERDRNADGHISLGSERSHRKLVVHVVYEPPDEEPVDDEEDGTGNETVEDGGENETAEPDENETQEAVDTVPPELVSSDPSNGETGVSINTSVMLRFDEEITPGSLSVRLEDLDGKVASMGQDVVHVDNDTVVWDLGTGLSHGMTYIVTIEDGAFVDTAGNPNERSSFTFYTEPAPPGPGPAPGNETVNETVDDDTTEEDTQEDAVEEDQSEDEPEPVEDVDDQEVDDDGTTGSAGGGSGTTRSRGVHANVCDASDFRCTAWTRCRDGTQTRQCERPSYCVGGFSPPEERECSMDGAMDTVEDAEPVAEPSPPERTRNTTDERDEEDSRDGTTDLKPVEAGNETIDGRSTPSQAGMTGMAVAEFEQYWYWWLVIAVLLVDLVWFGVAPLLLVLLWYRLNPWRSYGVVLEPHEY